MVKSWLLECHCGSFRKFLLHRKTYCFKMDKANTSNNSLHSKNKKRKIDDGKRIFHGD